MLTTLLLAGCSSPDGGAHPAAFELSDGSTLVVMLPEDARAETRERAVRYRMRSGITVTVEEIEVDERRTGEPHDAEHVARAIVERAELGDPTGALTERACTARGRPARCMTGWMQGERGRSAVRGLVLDSTQRIVLVLATRPTSDPRSPAPELDAILESADWGG